VGKHLAKIGLRRCYTCKRILPLIEEYFYRSKNKRFGFRDECNECSKKRKQSLVYKIKERTKGRANYRLSRKTLFQKLGHKLSSGVIHHIDGNRKNNSLRNLYVFPNDKAHQNYEKNVRTTYFKWIRWCNLNNISIFNL